MMPDELERLQINIEADASGTVAGAAQAKQALGELSQDAKRAAGGIRHGMDKAAQATTNVAKAAEKARKTLKPLAANPVNITAVRQAQAAVNAANEAVRKTLRPAMANPVDERGNVGAYKKYEFAKMPAAETSHAAAMAQTAAATAKVAQSATKAAENVRTVRKEIERVGRKGPTVMHSIGRSLRSMLIVTAVAGRLRSFIRWMGNVVSADKQVSASLAQVRGNLLTAFAPIYNTIIPAIRTLCSSLATATAWLSSFLGGLFGMSSTAAKDTANNLAGIGGAAGGASDQMKELLGSFDELNKLDRSKSGGGGGGGGAGIEFGEEIGSATGEGNRMKRAFKAAGETIATFAIALGGLKIAQQVAQWIAPLSGLANANAQKFGKWAAAITLAVNYIESFRHVMQDDRFKVKLNDIVESDDAQWLKTVRSVGVWSEKIAAAAIDSISKYFGVDGVDIWFQIKDWLWRNLSQALEWIGGAGAKFMRPVRELGRKIGSWIEQYIVQPIKDKWNAFVQWYQGLSIHKLFANDKGKTPSVTVDTKPAMTSLTALNKYLDQIDGKTAKATVTVEQIVNEVVKSSKQNVQQTVASNPNATIKDLSIGGALAVLGSTLKKKILGYASGGMGIPEGQLFIANESGAELVGHIGGKTAVANQQEISGAIWREMQQYRTGGGADPDAIADAVARALNGTAVKVGERQFGTLVVQAVNKNTRQMGRVDFAF